MQGILLPQQTTLACPPAYLYAGYSHVASLLWKQCVLIGSYDVTLPMLLLLPIMLRVVADIRADVEPEATAAAAVSSSSSSSSGRRSCRCIGSCSFRPRVGPNRGSVTGC